MEYVERKRTLFFGLPICFTKYCVNEEKINIKSGFLIIYYNSSNVYLLTFQQVCVKIKKVK